MWIIRTDDQDVALPGGIPESPAGLQNDGGREGWVFIEGNKDGDIVTLARQCADAQRHSQEQAGDYCDLKRVYSGGSISHGEPQNSKGLTI